MNKNFKKVLISTALIASVSFAQDATANNETAQAPATETAVATENAAAAPAAAPTAETVAVVPAAAPTEEAAPATAEVAAPAPAAEPAPVQVAEPAPAPVAEPAAPAAETSSADAAAKAAVAEIAPAAPAEKSAAKEPTFKLTGNVQTQAVKALYDNEKDNTLDGSFLRANFGGKFTSDDFEAVLTIRFFSPIFGTKVEVGDDKTSTIDKFSADTYYAKYKWDLGFGTLSTQFGRFRTDWSVGGNFGTYVDVDLNKRGFLARDYQHSAWQVGLESGISTFTAFVAADDANLNTGYVRVEEALKLGDAKIAAAYHSNVLDPIQHTAEVTHRIAGRADYHFAKNLGLYGEVAYITTGDGEDLSAPNAIKSEYGQDTQYLPFFVGLEIPTAGLLNNLYAELEYVGDREDFQQDADELAWAVTFIKKVGTRTKFQVTTYSEKEVSDVALAARVTATIQ